MGNLFKAPAAIIYLVGGLWGLFVCLAIVEHVGGWVLAGIAFFLAPIVLYFAPFYAGFVEHDWFPTLLVYGTTVLAGVLYTIGDVVDGRSR